MIDAPIIDLINGFNKLPYCFTVQCCYWHFIYSNQRDPYNFEPLPTADTITNFDHKIAYICLCIENSELGRGLLEALREITAIDPQTSRFVVLSGFGKGRLIPMHCRFNQTDLSIKSELYLISGKHFMRKVAIFSSNMSAGQHG